MAGSYSIYHFLINTYGTSIKYLPCSASQIQAGMGLNGLLLGVGSSGARGPVLILFLLHTCHEGMQGFLLPLLILQRQGHIQWVHTH